VKVSTILTNGLCIGLNVAREICNHSRYIIQHIDWLDCDHQWYLCYSDASAGRSKKQFTVSPALCKNIAASAQTKSEFSLLRTLTAWHCPHSPATRRCYWLLAVQQPIDISCPPGLQQQTCSSGFAAVGTDRRTDRETNTVSLHRPCCTYYVAEQAMGHWQRSSDPYKSWPIMHKSWPNNHETMEFIKL